MNNIQLKINVFKLLIKNHVYGCNQFKKVRKLKNVLNLLNVKMQYLLIIFHVHPFHHIVLQMELIVFLYQNVKHIKNLDVIKV